MNKPTLAGVSFVAPPMQDGTPARVSAPWTGAAEKHTEDWLMRGTKPHTRPVALMLPALVRNGLRVSIHGRSIGPGPVWIRASNDGLGPNLEEVRCHLDGQRFTAAWDLPGKSFSHSAVGSISATYRWEFRGADGTWRLLRTTRHPIRLALAGPVSPWESEGTADFMAALAVACQWADGASTEEEALSLLAQAFFGLGGQRLIGSRRRIVYSPGTGNLVDGGLVNVRAVINLSERLDGIAITFNCYDAAHATVLLAAALGVRAKVLELAPADNGQLRTACHQPSGRRVNHQPYDTHAVTVRSNGGATSTWPTWDAALNIRQSPAAPCLRKNMVHADGLDLGVGTASYLARLMPGVGVRTVSEKTRIKSTPGEVLRQPTRTPQLAKLVRAIVQPRIGEIHRRRKLLQYLRSRSVFYDRTDLRPQGLDSTRVVARLRSQGRAEPTVRVYENATTEAAVRVLIGMLTQSSTSPQKREFHTLALEWPRSNEALIAWGTTLVKVSFRPARARSSWRFARRLIEQFFD